MAINDSGNAYARNVYSSSPRWEEDEFSPSRQSRPRRSEQRLPETLKVPSYTRVERRKSVARSKSAMYMAIALGVICIFIQIARYAQIAVNSKQISSLRSEIQELDKQKENYELRISAREKSVTLENEVNGLDGFSKATQEQIRVIVLNKEKPGKPTMIAANTVD